MTTGKNGRKSFRSLLFAVLMALLVIKFVSDQTVLTIISSSPSDTSDIASNQRAKERSLEHEAKRRKKEIAEDPDLDAKRQHLIIVKAQATVISPTEEEGPIEQLNYICNRARVQWLIDYDTKSESRHECSITIDDVLVMRMYFCGDKTEAKLDACQRAMEILQRRDSEVRRGDFGKAKFGYLSSRDKRYGWRFPDEYLYATYETKLKVTE